ncbi:hypothetical protein KY289_008230 [Solanum tuberosum]|nr:hypothetical protein KY289_008230 [Solanum tuberosum]
MDWISSASPHSQSEALVTGKCFSKGDPLECPVVSVIEVAFRRPTKRKNDEVGKRWITPLRHEAADAELAPMPLAMSFFVPLPRHGGNSVARHEQRAKGRLSNSREPPYLIPT